jgi:hypothetical protein
VDRHQLATLSGPGRRRRSSPGCLPGAHRAPARWIVTRWQRCHVPAALPIARHGGQLQRRRGCSIEPGRRRRSSPVGSSPAADGKPAAGHGCRSLATGASCSR